MSLPISMLAIDQTGPGGPDVLQPAALPVPVPGPGQVILRLAYAGVNRPDALQRRGLYAPPPGASATLGLEGAGWVAALGPGVTRWKLGDPVAALLPGGGYAEYVWAEAGELLPVPPALPLRDAAALPEALFTVWSNVMRRARLAAGERFLVHGGASGIGTTAIQVARTLGARVFATAGSAEKCALCRELGAEAAYNYHDEDFTRPLRALGGVDVILDMVGGPYLPRNLEILAEEGRLVQIAYLQGAKTNIDLSLLMTKRLTITGSTLRPQSPAAKARYAAEIEAALWPHVISGAIRPVIDSEFPLAEAAKAHWRLESAGHKGKIILNMGAEA